jgi:hypothetical protein
MMKTKGRGRTGHAPYVFRVPITFILIGFDASGEPCLASQGKRPSDPATKSLS